jgi:putative ABC transport system permease protein
MSFYLDVVARLKPDVSLERASAGMNTIAARVARQFPKSNEGRGVALVPLQDSLVADVLPVLRLLAASVGFVLLIACANAANLLLVRSAWREGELAVRTALGATRARVARQLLTESVVVGLLGGAAGLLLSLWGRDVIVRLSPATVPRLDEVRLDGWVLGFTAFTSIATGLVFGLLPALIATSRDPIGMLKSGRRTAGSAASRLRHAFVVAEIAVSLVLLAGAGLTMGTVWRLFNVTPGFDPAHVLTMEVVVPRTKYPEPAQRIAFFEQVLERLRAVPGVRSAGATTALPLGGANMTFGMYQEGPLTADRLLMIQYRAVTPDYLRTLAVPLVAGRALAEADDTAGARPVAVVNETAARRYWPGVSPIGAQVAITRGANFPVWREVVGVVGDVRHLGLDRDPAPEIYVPYAHDPVPFLRFALRTNGDPMAVAAAARAAVWTVDPHQPVAKVRPMEDVLSASIAHPRFLATLIGSFAAIALVLAGIGLYAVMGYSVARRVHEIGVRMALGASRHSVLALVLRQGLALTGIGLAIGTALAVWLTRYLASELFGVTPTDPGTFALVSALLLLVALAATWIPAHRATRIDPMVALRQE